jgi:hypothetical protein
LFWLSPLLTFFILTLLGVKTVVDRSRSGLLKTITMHVQLLSALPQMSTTLSEGVGRVLRTSGAGSSIRMEGLECTDMKGWDGFWGPTYVSAALPFVVMLAAPWISFLAGIFVRDRGFVDRMRVAGFYVWSTLMFGALGKLFAVLNCTTYGSSRGHKYVGSALWIRCDGEYYGAVFAPILCLALLYVATTFVLFRKYLWTDRNLATETTKRDLSFEDVATGSVRFYLTAPYKEASYFWEVVQFSRRLVIALVMELSPIQSGFQPMLIALIMTITLAGHTWRKPFARAIDNLAETFSMVLLLSSFIIGVVLSNDNLVKNPAVVNGTSLFLVIVNGLFLGVLVVLYFKATAVNTHRKVSSWWGNRRAGSMGERDKDVPLLD